MNDKAIQRIFAGNEGIHFEFKCSRDVYEMVCAFLNRAGGDLLLRAE